MKKVRFGLLWYGVAMNVSLLETVLYILTMFCVGFLEEMIFRGFLFNAMAKDGIKSVSYTHLTLPTMAVV